MVLYHYKKDGSMAHARREIPLAFDQALDEICLVTSILTSKIRMNELTKNLELFSYPPVIVRAYQRLFPLFEVTDGIMTRHGSVEEDPDYGDKVFFHYQNTGRHSFEGRLKLLPHSWLTFKESPGNGLPKLVIDVVPCGSIFGRVMAVPFCLDQNCPSFIKTTLPKDVDMKKLAQQVRKILDPLREIQNEVKSCFP